MAISRKYNAESTTKEALILTKNFGFSKNQCIQIIRHCRLSNIGTSKGEMGRHGRPVRLVEPTTEVPAAEAASSDVTVSPSTHRNREEAFFEFGSCKDQISKPVGINVEKLKMMALIRSRIDPGPGRQTHSPSSLPKHSPTVDVLYLFFFGRF